MNPIDKIAAFAPIEFDPELRELHTVERVRSYLEKNFGCTKNKEIINALDLHPRTVAKALKIIRGQHVKEESFARPRTVKKKEYGSFYEEDYKPGALFNGRKDDE